MAEPRREWRSPDDHAYDHPKEARETPKGKLCATEKAMRVPLLLVALFITAILRPVDSLCPGPKPYNYCPNGYGTWSASNMPPGCSQLYDPNGPWNTPVPPNPTIDPNSANINAWLYSQECCTGGLLGDMGWGHHGYALDTFFSSFRSPV